MFSFALLVLLALADENYADSDLINREGFAEATAIAEIG